MSTYGGSDELRHLVQTMVTSLVDAPDSVKITMNDSGQTLVLEISVASTDLGKVIGKGGRNAMAMRTILNGAATKIKRRVVLEIVQPGRVGPLREDF